MPSSTVARSRLVLTDLHASLRDPLLDTMNFLNEIANRYPDAISFAPGRPYDEPFDAGTVAGYLHTYERYLREERGLSAQQAGSVLFQYGRTKGQIHELISATIRNDEGIEVDPESVVVTVGAQEGMLLVLRALIRDADDVLLVCSPCYVGITGAARLLDVTVEPVPEGITGGAGHPSGGSQAPAGVDPEAIRAAARRLRSAGKRPRAVYLVPDFANPSGVRMPLAAREALLRVAADEDLLVIEDNPYGLFTRTDTRLPVLKRLDRDCRVVYLGSFAKTCFPGARVGYVIADQQVVGGNGAGLLADELSKIKSMTTVNTSPIAQAAIGGMLLANDCRLQVSNQERISQYRTRLNRLIAALEREMASLPVSWNVPDGGYFLVLSVPFTADDRALARSASDHGVLWTPMSYFYLDGGGSRQIRLSASYLDIDRIDEGVSRLHGFIRSEQD
jgi:(S)-3,5-dihydroxyphenylglycine transaminase